MSKLLGFGDIFFHTKQSQVRATTVTYGLRWIKTFSNTDSWTWKLYFFRNLINTL